MNHIRYAPLQAAVLVAVLLAMPQTSSAWDLGGNLISLDDWIPIDAVMISDGAQGSYIAWVDRRSGSWNTYCQHIDGDGNALWADGGVLVSDNLPGAYSTRLMLADDGGVFVSWAGNGVHVHRLTADGLPAWPQGVDVTNLEGVQRQQILCPDGAGGLVMVFHCVVDLDNRGYRVQRLAGDGTRLWTDEGVALGDGLWASNPPGLVATSDGQFVVVWNDAGLHAQRLNLDGQMLWQADGVPVGSGSEHQQEPQVLADDEGGCFVFWRDVGDEAPGLDGQYLDAGGAGQWSDDGLCVSCTGDEVNDFTIVTDAEGGTIFCLEVGGWTPDLLMNRIGADGGKLWGEEGITPVVAPGYRHMPELAPDGAGGAYLAWRDDRRECHDIYAQHLSASGEVLWDQAGVMVAAFDGHQAHQQVIASESDQLVAIWLDSGVDDGLYALQIGADGSGITTECVPTTDVPTLQPSLRLLANVPNPFNPRTSIRFELDRAGPVRLAVYDMKGRFVVELLNRSLPAGDQSVEWTATNEHGQYVATGVYLVKLVQGDQVALRKVMLIR